MVYMLIQQPVYPSLSVVNADLDVLASRRKLTEHCLALQLWPFLELSVKLHFFPPELSKLLPVSLGTGSLF